MAQTYVNTPVLSKVKFGNQTYYMKDADVRAILDTFGNVVTLDKALNVTENGTGLVDAALLYSYVGQQVGTLGQVLNLRSESDHTTIANPQTGDFVVEADHKEWLFDGTAWRVVGDESSYVLKTTTVAGVDLADNITVAELQQALGLKALAYKDNGSVSVTTVDSIDSFSTGKAGEYNVSSTPVSVPATYSALDVTPAGSVTLTAGTAAAASYDKTTGVTVATAAPTDGQSATYTPAGQVTVTNVTVTPDKVSVAKVTSAGEAYQLTGGSAVKAADTKSAFATEGYIVSVGTDASGSGGADESETLIFTAAATADAVTAAGDVTYTAPTLSGSLPTFGTESVVSGISSASASASFSGTGVMINATPTHTASDATMTQPTFTAAFEGTSKTVTPAVATTTPAAGTDGKVTVASETIAPTFQNSAKTVNVNFGVNS